MKRRSAGRGLRWWLGFLVGIGVPMYLVYLWMFAGSIERGTIYLVQSGAGGGYCEVFVELDPGYEVSTSNRAMVVVGGDEVRCADGSGATVDALAPGVHVEVRWGGRTVGDSDPPAIGADLVTIDCG